MLALARKPNRVFGWRPPDAHARRLRSIIAESVDRPPESDWHEIPEVVRKLAPDRALAVVGYGSWYMGGLRRPTSFADVYLVIDDYASFYQKPFHAWMNRHLPPNVYFLWTTGDGHRSIRGKYNVISRDDLGRECSSQMRDVYSAGRLTKLVWLAWSRDEATRGWLVSRLFDAHTSLMPTALALLPERFSDEDFSLELLGLSYRGEARLEGWERVRLLHDEHAERYRVIHGVLLDAFGQATGMIERTQTGYRKSPDPRWQGILDGARRLVTRSRMRGYLRWPRIILTEPNLVDLAVNEAERKAGVRINVTPRLRRHPLVFGLPEYLRVLRARKSRARIR